MDRSISPAVEHCGVKEQSSKMALSEKDDFFSCNRRLWERRYHFFEVWRGWVVTFWNMILCRIIHCISMFTNHVTFLTHCHFILTHMLTLRLSSNPFFIQRNYFFLIASFIHSLLHVIKAANGLTLLWENGIGEGRGEAGIFVVVWV